MIVSTTESLEGKRIVQYLGVVSGDCVIGANFLKDFFARIRDVVGGRVGSYENVIRDAKELAIEDMAEAAEKLGANAIVGVDLDYEAIGESMLMVSANGTAVVVE